MCFNELLVKPISSGTFSFFEHFFFFCQRWRFLFLSVFFFFYCLSSFFFFYHLYTCWYKQQISFKHTFVYRKFSYACEHAIYNAILHCSQTVRELFISSNIVDTIFLLFVNNLRTASTVFDLVNRIFDVSSPERTAIAVICFSQR